jgi:hypothetical protein
MGLVDIVAAGAWASSTRWTLSGAERLRIDLSAANKARLDRSRSQLRAVQNCTLLETTPAMTRYVTYGALL